MGKMDRRKDKRMRKKEEVVMKKKGNRFLTLAVMTGIVMLALAACGGYGIETGSVSGGAVSGQVVSGSAISDSTALNIHVMTEGKVTIPDPADVEGSADVYLRKSPDDDEVYDEEGNLVQALYDNFVADLSFLGFDEPVFVSSYAVGNLTKITDSITHVMTQTKKGIKEKEVEGDCLALFVTTGIPTAEDYKEYEVGSISPSYIVVLDYGAGKCYKVKTDFCLHNIWYWNNLEAIDLTGDGVQELVVKHRYNKTSDFGAYRIDQKTENLREIYSTRSEECGYREINEFEGTLLDDYKIKLEFPCIGYSHTISMVKDAGYKEEELQIENRLDEYGYTNYGALWEDGVLKSNAIIGLYTMDHVDYIRNKDGSIRVDFAWTVALEHRSCTIGLLHVYYEYDESKDTLVLAGAKYVNREQAEKEWKEWYKEEMEN